jgi:hypothetical protein
MRSVQIGTRRRRYRYHDCPDTFLDERKIAFILDTIRAAWLVEDIEAHALSR